MAGSIVKGSGGALQLSAAQLQLAAQSLQVLLEVAKTASDVVRMKAETQRFVTEVDQLAGLLEHDAAAVWQVVEPLTKLLMADHGLSSADRLRVVEAIKAISAPSVQGRADAINEVAKKIRT